MKKCSEGKKKGHMYMGKSKPVVISRVQRSSPELAYLIKRAHFRKRWILLFRSGAEIPLAFRLW